MDLKPGMTFEGAVNRYHQQHGFGLYQCDKALSRALEEASPVWLSTIGSYRISIQRVEPDPHPITPGTMHVTYNSYFVQQHTSILFEISRNKPSQTFADSIVCELNMGAMRVIGGGSCPHCGGSGKLAKDKMLEIAEVEFRRTAEAAIKNGSSYVSYWMPSIMVSTPGGEPWFTCPACTKKLETVAHLGTRVLDL